MIDAKAHINVVDSPTGTGKTTWAIGYIQTLPQEQKVIYITPYLNEVERIIDACPTKNFIQPDVRLGKGSKRNHLLQLLLEGRNIVSTHALFSAIDDELIEALRSQGYILMLDEVMNVIEKFDMYSDFSTKGMNIEQATIQDIKTLLETGLIYVDDDFTIRWRNEDQTLAKYQTLKNLADRGLLYLVNDTFLMWSFPIEVFMQGIFERIWILTYMFEAQIQAYYYQYFGLTYDLYHIEQEKQDGIPFYFLERTTDRNYELDWLKKVHPLIHIYEGKGNKIGAYYRKATTDKTYRTALSKSWYNNFRNMHEIVSKGMESFFRTIDAPTEKRMWTCFKENVGSLKTSKAHPKNWIEITARATNDFGDRTALAYLVNRYVHPFYAAFLRKRNIEVDADKFALSEMVQWIFRSAVRNEQEIWIYIPSERMRLLLQQWLAGRSLEHITGEDDGETELD